MVAFEEEGEQAALSWIEVCGEFLYQFPLAEPVAVGQRVGQVVVDWHPVVGPVPEAVREDALALPRNPCHLLPDVAVLAQGGEVEPNGDIAVLHQLAAGGVAVGRMPPTEGAYQSPVPREQAFEQFIFRIPFYVHFGQLLYIYNNHPNAKR